MDFSESTKDEAYKRSGGRCECHREHTNKINAPHYSGRCASTFSRHGNWHAHHKIAVKSGGDNTLSNCEAICVKCHELTKTFGAS